jgi:hypothetical protein
LGAARAGIAAAAAVTLKMSAEAAKRPLLIEKRGKWFIAGILGGR